MARYFIDIFDGETVVDEDGEEFADLDAARMAALRTLTETLGSREKRFWSDGSLSVQVRDEAGAVVADLMVQDRTSV